MKQFLFFLWLACLATVSFSQENHAPAIHAKKVAGSITAADWQSDLRFLQHTVHKDYPFLFKNVTAKEFDASIEKLHAQVPTLQPHEILAGVGRIIASFKYGHTNVRWREAPVAYHQVPVSFYWFSDGLFVEGSDKENADIVGAKLVKVEGVPVMQAVDAIKELVPLENEEFFKAYGLDFLGIPEALHAQHVSKQLKENITYTFEKNGKTFDKTIVAKDAFRLPRNYGYVDAGTDWVSIRDQSITPHYLKDLDKIYYFEYLPASKTLYVRHSQIQDEKAEPIPAFYKRVFDFIDKNDVEKLVLDVRLNGGGNNYKNKPIVTGIIENKKINQPGKLFVIIGRRTFSACQNLVNELSNYTNAIFVGEPTAENINFYGDNRQVVLPNSGLPVYLSFAWWQDKPQWENGPWLAPQLTVDMSFEDYRLSKDPVLEACLNFSGKDIVLDPMGHLRQLFEAGKLDKVETEAKRMIADPKYRYVGFEGKINQSGYDLMNDKKMDQAVYVFELNTRLFPKSANTWDSLGEAMLISNKTDKAIQYYNKAIELDPDGGVGANARNMLQKIKSGKTDK